MNNVARALVDRLTVKFAGEIAQDTDGYDLFKLCDGAWGGGTGLRGWREGHQSVFYKLWRLKPVLFVTGGGSQFFLARKKFIHVA